MTDPQFLAGGIVPGGPHPMTAYWHGDHYSFTRAITCPGRPDCDRLLTKAEVERYGLSALRAINEKASAK